MKCPKTSRDSRLSGIPNPAGTPQPAFTPPSSLQGQQCCPHTQSAQHGRTPVAPQAPPHHTAHSFTLLFPGNRQNCGVSPALAQGLESCLSFTAQSFLSLREPHGSAECGLHRAGESYFVSQHSNSYLPLT